ncbi:MAG: hypothetical protein ACFFDW_01505 [Candidatus Thorarchaeota archaeon]
MKDLFYYLKARRVSLFKTIIALSLLFLCSFTAFFLPQLVNPHILGKYFNNFTNQSIDINEYANISWPDFELATEIEQSTLLYHLENYSWCVNQASLKAFGFSNPKNMDFIHSKLMNISIGGEFFFKNLIGVDDAIFQEMLLYSSNSTHENGAILCSTNNTDLLGYYNFELGYGVNKQLLVNKFIPFSSLLYFPEFSTYYNFSNHVYDGLIEKFFILPYSQLYDFYSGFNHYLNQYGFILFTQDQKDIIYWSFDSVERIELFKQELINNFHSINLDINIYFINYYKAHNLAVKNQFVINLAYSFINCLQIVIWILVLSFLIMAITNFQNSLKEKELKVLLTGQTWVKRLRVLGVETIIISVLSFAIALGLFIPFVYLQKLFPMEFNIQTKFYYLFLFLGIHTVIVYLLFIDFELYLRKFDLKHASQNKSYKLFLTWPWYLKLILGLSLILLIWLISETLTIFLFLLGFIGIALLGSALIIGLFITVNFTIQKISRIIKRRKNQSVSNVGVLWKLWERKTIRRFIIFITLFSVIFGGYLFSNYNASVLRSKAEWYTNSSQVITSINFDVNSTLLDVKLNNYSNIEHFEKSLLTYGFLNHSDQTNIYFDESPLISDLQSIFIGINSSNYLEYYSVWRESKLLLDGKLSNFGINKLFLTNSLSTKMNCKIGDFIQLSNGDGVEQFQVTGIINHWPGLESLSNNWTNIIDLAIIDINQLNLLQSNYTDFQILYYIHTPIDKINETTNYLQSILIELGSFEWIGYVDPYLYTGLWIVFGQPIILEFELLILIIGIVLIIGNLKSKWFSSEAKSLGMLALNSNYLAPLIEINIFQFLYIIVGSFLLLPLMYFLTYIYYTFNPINLEPSLFIIRGIDMQIFTKILLIFCLFIILVLIDLIIDILKFKKLDLSIIYKHME